MKTHMQKAMFPSSVCYLINPAMTLKNFKLPDAVFKDLFRANSAGTNITEVEIRSCLQVRVGLFARPSENFSYRLHRKINTRYNVLFLRRI